MRKEDELIPKQETKDTEIVELKDEELETVSAGLSVGVEKVMYSQALVSETCVSFEEKKSAGSRLDYKENTTGTLSENIA